MPSQPQISRSTRGAFRGLMTNQVYDRITATFHGEAFDPACDN